MWDKLPLHVIVLAEFATISGGAQRVAIESAFGLANDGHKVSFVHALAGSDPLLDHPNISLHCLGLTDIWQAGLIGGIRIGLWNQIAAQRLSDCLQALQGQGPTVLHLHQWTRAFSPAIFPVLAASGLPIFLTAHDYFLCCPNGTFYRFNQHQPCAFKPLGGACLMAGCDPISSAHKAIRVARTFLARQNYADLNATLLHVCSHSEERLSPFLPVGWRHERLNNPIRAEQRPRPDAEIGKKHFAYIGRLTVEKGVLLAAEAALRAEQKILFIGEGPAAEAILKLNPQAEITGWLAAEELPAYLQSHVRAVLAPSLWPETGPMTVYEAQALGIATLVSDRSGASETIDGRNGLKIAPDISSWVEALRRLSDDREAERMGAQAFASYWAHPLDLANHVEKLVGIYRNGVAKALCCA